MTLLVVAIDPPEIVRDVAAPGTLWSALADLFPQIFSFFLAFVLLGRYWMAHHEFVASLKSIDRTIMGATLAYLAFVAFLPFPTALVGEYEQNPVSVVLFASTLCLVSGMEAILFSLAVRRGHTRKRFDARSFRYGLLQSLTPVVLFAISIPIAFWNPTLALLTWLLGIPIGIALARLRPVDARGYVDAMSFTED